MPSYVVQREKAIFRPGEMSQGILALYVTKPAYESLFGQMQQYTAMPSAMVAIGVQGLCAYNAGHYKPGFIYVRMA